MPKAKRTFPKSQTPWAKKSRAKNPKNLAKTTVKGAYNRKKKKNMMIRNAPFKETKIREAYEIAARNITPDPRLFTAVDLGVATINYTSIPLNPFYRMSMGIREDQVTGRSEYGKWLKCKYSIKFPTSATQITEPMRVYQVHGWLKVPLSFTATTTPTEGGATQPNMATHIENQLAQYFDAAQDKLSFIPKNTNIKILSYRQLTTNRNKQLTGGFPVSTFGGIDVVSSSVSWKIMRKIQRSVGTPAAPNDNSDTTDTQNLYPNHSWLPFLYLYTPDDGAVVGVPNKLQIAHNSIYYYTDS